MPKPRPILEGTKLQEEWSCEVACWKEEMGALPKALLLSEDNPESYEMDRKHLFELEDGKFAVVEESGCSCYESSDAIINTYPSFTVAKEEYDKL